MLSQQQYLSQRLQGIRSQSVDAVLAMHSEGATVPFMARYRKEKTGNLDEVQIRSVLEAYEDYTTIVQRKDFVLKEIEKQGNLTAEIKKTLESSWLLSEIEEIYRPYKKKKKTKAALARDAGLGPLAEWIWGLCHGDVKDSMTLEVKAKEFISAAKGYATYDEALRGAQAILIERLSNDPEIRRQVRDHLAEQGKLVSQRTADFKPHSKFTMYAEYSEPIKAMLQRRASHRYLAIRRGWQEGELKVSIEGDEAILSQYFESRAITSESQATEYMKNVVKAALTVHVMPSISNEIHAQLKEQADLDAIQVFAENVKRVLMSSPFGAKVVLGVDPGVRTGCKVALVSQSGGFISHTVLHIQGDEAQKSAQKLLSETLSKLKIDAIAVGNGTGGREAESFLRSVLKSISSEVPVIMVSEAGASVYSASDVAREEFPDLDLTVRGAISIARRLQDPLAELVKIEPKSIGVGQYQHDVNSTKLKKSLHDVVESCVNQVGVEVNTASQSLLQYVAGIGPATAKNIVLFRSEKGLFKSREDLLKVPQLSSKVYEQSAGFLRIIDSQTVLDRTGIHPERYSAVREMAQQLGVNVASLTGAGAAQLKSLREKWATLIGEFTFDDIVVELEKPGRDPRDMFKVFNYRDDIHEIKDLKPGLICPGLVTNVTNFGAFVDIGVHQDGLVHISELSHQFVDDPKKVVSPGDAVQVKVLAVDLEKNQISLTMKLEEKPMPTARPQNAVDQRGPRADKKSAGGPRGGKSRKNSKGAPQKGGGQRPDNRPNRVEKKPFNNPFAALSGLKGE